MAEFPSFKPSTQTEKMDEINAVPIFYLCLLLQNVPKINIPSLNVIITPFKCHPMQNIFSREIFSLMH